MSVYPMAATTYPIPRASMLGRIVPSRYRERSTGAMLTMLCGVANRYDGSRLIVDASEDLSVRLLLFLNKTNVGTCGGGNGEHQVPARRDRSCKGYIGEKNGTQLLRRTDRREKYRVFLAHGFGQIKRIYGNRLACSWEGLSGKGLLLAAGRMLPSQSYCMCLV
jgi:hypothetical protein